MSLNPRVNHSHNVKLSNEALPPPVRSLLHLRVLRENRDQGRRAPSALSSGLVYSKSAHSCFSILCASGAHSEQAGRRAEALFESSVWRLRWSQRSSDTRLCSVDKAHLLIQPRGGFCAFKNAFKSFQLCLKQAGTPSPERNLRLMRGSHQRGEGEMLIRRPHA